MSEFNSSSNCSNLFCINFSKQPLSFRDICIHNFCTTGPPQFQISKIFWCQYLISNFIEFLLKNSLKDRILSVKLAKKFWKMEYLKTFFYRILLSLCEFILFDSIKYHFCWDSFQYKYVCNHHHHCVTV